MVAMFDSVTTMNFINGSL